MFAVGDKLDVTADTSAAVVGFNLHFNTLAKAAIMGLFRRQVEAASDAGVWNDERNGVLSLGDQPILWPPGNGAKD